MTPPHTTPFSSNRSAEQANPQEQALLEALGQIQLSEGGQDIVALGFVSNIRVHDKLAQFDITLPAQAAGLKDQIQSACIELAKGVTGIEYVSPNLIMPKAGPQRPATPKLELPGITHILAVSSGKGGVGKTTVSVNLACAMQQQGQRVGILDADIYGPNVPLMMGVQDATIREKTDDGKMKPPEGHGVKVMSMNFLLKPGQPVIWRGPLLDRVIRQFFTDTGWGELDVLIVDLPPGTGDAQLTLMEAVPLTGAVIVTTPQEVSLIDSRKGLSMFQNADIPVLGVLENMSYYQPQGTTATTAETEKIYLFGQGGGQKLADEAHVPLLGQIPINPAIRTHADEGQPIMVADTACPEAQAFKHTADQLLTAMAALPNQPTGHRQPALA
ncbi:MAG: Mrp/NBP35 family ATP-binding protein [Vampirovibrionales bacterium]